MNKTTSSQDVEKMEEDSSKAPVNVQEPINKADDDLVPVSEQSSVLLKRRVVDEDHALLSGEDDASKRQKNLDVAGPAGSSRSVPRLENFTFRYQNDEPFVNDKDACANMCRLIKGPFKFPPLEEIEEAEAYKEFARATTRMVGFANRLTEAYDRKLKAAQRKTKEMDEIKKRSNKAKDALKEEKVKSTSLEIDMAVLKAHVAKLKIDNNVFATENEKLSVEKETLLNENEKLLSENTKLKEKLKSETQRLRDSREKCIQKEKQKAIDRVRRGPIISEADRALLEANKAKFEAEIDKMDIFKLRENDLTMTMNRQRSQTAHHSYVTSIENMSLLDLHSREDVHDLSSTGAAQTKDEAAAGT